MHETRRPKVKGFIDEFREVGEKIYVKGWICPLDRRTPYTMKVVCDGTEVGNLQYGIMRQDVSDFYYKDETEFGFVFEIPKTYKEASVIISGTDVVFKLPEDLPKSDNPKKTLDDSIFKNTNEWKSFVCVDNFYDDPDAVRNFALQQDFKFHKEYHKGRRTDFVFRPQSLKEKFERILGKKITSWDKYGVNGCFQYCTAEDQVVYHYDSQNYAGVVYLTPNAPADCGTTFYKSKVNGLMKIWDSPHATATGKSFDELQNETFKTGFYDSTQFERVDTVGNMYNRLVLWDAKLLHAASNYFGTDLHNSRLFHLFFFDVEK